MVEVRLLGTRDVRGPGGESLQSILAHPKRFAVLSYLSLTSLGAFVSRDRIVGAFWPDSSEARGRNALSQILHWLRRSLGREVLLARGSRDVGLNADRLWCDAHAFGQLIAKGRNGEALSLYTGDLLEGFHLDGTQEFDAWMAQERGRLKALAAGVAWQVAHELLAGGNLGDAERTARRATHLSGLAEGEVRRFVAALAAAGDRAAAVRFYERYAAMLERDLELRPDAETRLLVEDLRASREVKVEGATASKVETQPGPERDLTLDRLRSALSDLYRVEREIGRGGMATVYVAQDLKHERKVALKVLDPSLAASVGAARFLGEIRTAAALTHPHILPLHDSGEAEGFLYYVMPYTGGESLRDRLNRERQLSVEEALRIVREVADALDYAHRRGVVHRDIKPANVLLEESHAVVADFGIAKAIGAGAAGRLTGPGAALGAPEYMSPEQAGGREEVDGRSDIYALGCVLYEMLAGRPPFLGPTVESVIRQHLAATAPDLTIIRPTVPRSVSSALQRALAKAPADRFRSAAEFSKALAARRPARPRDNRLRGLALGSLAGVALIATALTIVRFDRVAPVATELPFARTAIAVLPLQNLTPEGPYAFFAAGLHDEILTQLSKVAALKPIGRSSVMSYTGADLPPLEEIARELRVGSVVEGSVQIVGTRLRVNVYLMDASSGEHLWSQSYDRTLDDAFAIQSDVARQIVVALGAALAPTEERRLAEAPTDNADAYNLYLQGLQYSTRPGFVRTNLQSAQQLFARALELDPDFALAHAAISEVHGFTHWMGYDVLPDRVAQQRLEAEAALRLAPELPQAHKAMGLAHYHSRAWADALGEYEIAMQGLPNDAELAYWIAWVHRRLKNWDAVRDGLARAVELNPRDANLFFDLSGITLLLQHRYEEAVTSFDRAVNLAPDLYEPAIFKGRTYVLWRGQTDTLRAVLRRVPAGASMVTLGTVAAERLQMLRWERQPDSILVTLSQAGLGVYDAQYIYLPRWLYAAWAHQMRADLSAARAAFDSALVTLDSVRTVPPSDWRIHTARGLALAGLGRREEAVQEADWLRRSVIYRDDGYIGPIVAEDRAHVLAQAGEWEAALDEIERLLSEPSFLSLHTLRLDPMWDPIRAHPRFRALLAPER